MSKFLNIRLHKINYLILFFCCFFLSSKSFSQDAISNDLLGTNQVTFMPWQAEGKLLGCTLVFDAIILDRVYKSGAPIYVAGNINFYGHEGQAAIGLKLGTMSLNTQKRQPPNFAYFQTATGNTSNLKYSAYDGEPQGMKVFVYPLTEETIQVYQEILEKNQITIGFNFKKGATDILVPIDLTVKETVEDGKLIKRIHSQEMVSQFAQCNSNLMEKVKSEIN